MVILDRKETLNEENYFLADKHRLFIFCVLCQQDIILSIHDKKGETFMEEYVLVPS